MELVYHNFLTSPLIECKNLALDKFLRVDRAARRLGCGAARFGKCNDLKFSKVAG